MIIVNAPLRNDVDISTWGLSKPGTICNGGTWTRDPLNFATNAQLEALAASKKDVIYSVCLARTPEQELAEVNRYLSFGVNIVAVRLGNEENQYVDMTGIWAPAAYAYGEAQGAQYVTNVQPYADILPFPRIYSGEFPSNMQSTRFELFREGWNKGISDNINAEDKIDMHIYQNQEKLINLSQEIDLSYLTQEPKPIPNKFVIIESGIPIQTVIDEDSFVSQTIDLWERIRLALREDDEFGVQLMEQAEYPIGMIYNGELTELGLWINALYQVEEEEPKVVITKRLMFVSWFSGIYSYGLYTLSDGRSVFRRYLKSETPYVGDEWVE